MKVFVLYLEHSIVDQSVISSVAADVLPRRHRATGWFIIQAASCIGSTFGTLGAAGLVRGQGTGYPGWRIVSLVVRKLPRRSSNSL